MIIEVVDMVDEKVGVPKKLEELLDELVEEIRNAKTPEEVEALETKAKAARKLIEAYEGDKDLEKIPAIMDKVGDMIEDILGPLKELLNELYSPERVQAMGKSVAEFYKNLTEAGMDKDAALELTKEYMDAINPGKKLMEMLANFTRKGNVTVHGPRYFGHNNEREANRDGE
jgi:DNA repair ATPase RecN